MAAQLERHAERRLLLDCRLCNSFGMTTTVPKPGPHLHPSAPTPEPHPRPLFRELAKRHAVAASDFLLAAQDADHPDQADELLQLADVAAHVSLACSAIAPAVPNRYVHKAGESR